MEVVMTTYIPVAKGVGVNLDETGAVDEDFWTHSANGDKV
jgi:hypothetical protein